MYTQYPSTPHKACDSKNCIQSAGYMHKNMVLTHCWMWVNGVYYVQHVYRNFCLLKHYSVSFLMPVKCGSPVTPVVKHRETDVTNAA